MDTSLFWDVAELAILALCIMLFLSNFHMCGKIGEAAYQTMRGLFGILGLIAPIVLFSLILFLMISGRSGKNILRVAMGVLIFAAFCGVVQLLCTNEFIPEYGMKEYFDMALNKTTGGAVGGFFFRGLYPSFGMLGSYIIMILLIMAAAVILFQKSVIKPIEETGRRVYESTRDDMKRRAELRRVEALERENQRKLEYEREMEALAARRNQAYAGVNMENLIIDDSDGAKGAQQEMKVEPLPEKKAAKTKAEASKKMEAVKKTEAPKIEETAAQAPVDNAQEENPALVFKASIHGMTGKGIISIDEEVKAEQEAQEKKEQSRKVSLKDDEIFVDDDEILDKGPLRAKKIRSVEEPERGRKPEIYEIEDIPVNKKEDAPEIGAYDAVEQPEAEFETFVSGNGKVITREIDPTEPDIITQKLKEKNSKGASVFRESGGQRSGSGATTFTDMKEFSKDKNVTGSGKPNLAGPITIIKEEKKPERPYVKPPKGLLKKGGQDIKNRDDELRETAVKLQQTLQNFNVGVTVTNISCGPSVTRYELTPEQGVKVSRIVALQDDIKLSLAASDIRIEAPIPGKSAVGIEVPNKENMTVWLRDVLDSDSFKNHPSKLAFGVGCDIGGNMVVTDLAKMPHLLIAGATGSGKSVCINTLIMSIIYKADPKEVKLLMVDPKVVELSIYNGIPHLLIPVVTDPKKASGALNWAVANMTDRYKKFAEKNVRDLRGYNQKIKEEEGENAELLPQIVIIVDELADLMMVAPGEVEDAICRLAQMARAAGIHLVLATQRPSVNVITGLIKANVPSRIAFSVSSGVDSRTIIDMVGAEKLLGKGDMLFYPSGFQKPARVQGAFVSDEEVSAVVKFLTDRSDVTYSEELEKTIAGSGSAEFGADTGSGGDLDEYFAEAGKFIIQKEKASIGMLQRAFKIGFNRAARIMDQLAEAGVVGEEEGTKPRKILMTMQEFNEYLGGE